MADEEAQKKAQEREAKKAEVRRRLEEAGSKKKAKKGFLTPERKKKLRKLLMVKAAEDLKRQQLAKEQERQKILSERTPKLPDIDTVEDHAKLEAIYNDLFSRVCKLEEEKYDINFLVSQTEASINQLTIEVNDLRGKYVKPVLKKVSKYDNKFKKMAQASADKETAGEKKLDFRGQLKVVKKDVMEEISKPKKKDDKPDWSKKDKGAPKAEEPKEEAKPVEEPPKEEEPAAEPEPEEEEEGGDEEEEEEE